jgi:hypothetical protein
VNMRDLYLPLADSAAIYDNFERSANAHRRA